jgi:hypothetical protein
LDRFVTRVHALADADAVLWLPTSTNNAPVGFTNASLARRLVGGHGLPRLVVLDEGDHHGVYPPAAKLPYLAYFKRSWVKKRDGLYLGPGARLPRAFFPLPYAASDAYHPLPGGRDGATRRFESLAARPRPVVSSLRCDPSRQPTRCKVLNWTAAAAQRLVADLPLAGRQATGAGPAGVGQSVVGEVNRGGRKEINAGYFATMRQARIVVTCNPSHWYMQDRQQAVGLWYM